MSFDPNFNSGQADGFMSSENILDFTGLPDNEDSIDISNLLSDDYEEDIFKTILSFSGSSSPDLKKEESENFFIGGGYDNGIESCQQYLQSGPSSSYASVCSSAATSPIPFHHTFETPPLTPTSEKSLLRQQLQINGPTASSMTSTQYSVMQEQSNMNRQQRYDTRQNIDLCLDLELPQHKTETTIIGGSTLQRDAKVASGISSEYMPVKQEGNVDMDMPLALTTDRTKQPLSSNLNMSNKRSAVSQSIEPRSKKSKAVAKGTPEYMLKRERNNVAVRRSRDKAKRKALETQEKVQSLTEENKMLREEVKNLKNEVNTLKGLLQNISQHPYVKT